MEAKVSAELIEIIGWVPGIIFPGAALIQLLHILRSESVEGVSTTTWGLCALANLCMYTYTEKFYEPQALLLLIAAALQFGIVAVLVRRRRTSET